MSTSLTIQYQLIVTDYRWAVARLPFRQAVGHALKTRRTTQSFIVRLTDAAGRHGYGEGAPREYIAGESIEAAGPQLEQLLHEHPLPVINSVADIGAYTARLLAATDHPSVVCAVETALLDLYGQATGRSLSDLLAEGERQGPVYSMVIPFLPLEAARQYLGYVHRLRLPHLKIKVGFAGDVEFVQQLLNEVPAGCVVRVDANRGWSYAEAVAKCQQLHELGIHYVEEPLRDEDANRLPELSRAVDVRLGLDESLFTLEQARHFHAELAPERLYFNLKLSKCGGYLNARRIWSFARRHGIPCQLGCNVGETAILSALGRAFARHHALLFLEGSFNDWLLEADLTEPKLSFGEDGKAPSLTQPGLGLDINLNHPTLSFK